MWYGPIKKKENVCPCGEKVEILFWGGESWNVEMLLQAKQLPQLLSEMPRVDGKNKTLYRDSGEVTEAASVFRIKFRLRLLIFFKKVPKFLSKSERHP